MIWGYPLFLETSLWPKSKKKQRVFIIMGCQPDTLNDPRFPPRPRGRSSFVGGVSGAGFRFWLFSVDFFGGGGFPGIWHDIPGFRGGEMDLGETKLIIFEVRVFLNIRGRDFFFGPTLLISESMFSCFRIVHGVFRFLFHQPTCVNQFFEPNWSRRYGTGP